MTLGELIRYLEGLNPESTSAIELSNPHSYRGGYEDVAFVVSTSRNQSAGDMLEEARSAIGIPYESVEDACLGPNSWVYMAEEWALGEELSWVVLELAFRLG